MTYQEINETIALERGWKQSYNDFGWFGWKRGHHSLPECPDYVHSVDLCREFELSLPVVDRQKYLLILSQTVYEPDTPIDWLTYAASPESRCKSYLIYLRKL